eukprot:c29092_g1_i7 orf=2086-2580(-)
MQFTWLPLATFLKASCELYNEYAHTTKPSHTSLVYFPERATVFAEIPQQACSAEVAVPHSSSMMDGSGHCPLVISPPLPSRPCVLLRSCQRSHHNKRQVTLCTKKRLACFLGRGGKLRIGGQTSKEGQYRTRNSTKAHHQIKINSKTYLKQQQQQSKPLPATPP